MRELTSLGLKEAKDLVDGAPKAVLEKANKEAAEAAKAKLEDAGAPSSSSNRLRLGQPGTAPGAARAVARDRAGSARMALGLRTPSRGAVDA